jgi:hypothetical protein
MMSLREDLRRRFERELTDLEESLVSGKLAIA